MASSDKSKKTHSKKVKKTKKKTTEATHLRMKKMYDTMLQQWKNGK